MSAIRSFKDLSLNATFFWMPRVDGSSSYSCYQKVSPTEASELGTGIKRRFPPDEPIFLRLAGGGQAS